MELKKQKKYVEDSTNQSSESENQSDDGDHAGNPGWADSIAQVLKSKKPKKKKSLVLSRAKKLDRVKKEKDSYDFEIDGEITEHKPIKNVLDKEVKIKKEPKQLLSLRVKPSVSDREREKTLKKIATKGVVQLFNAVRIQQKDLNKQLKEAGPLDHRRDAVLNNINKRKFLDVLMGGERAKSEWVDNAVKDEKVKEEGDEEENNFSSKSQWSVLRDDFMTNKKLKHWDQEDSDSEESGGGCSDDKLSSDNE